jgi:cysteine dioxygenase type I
MKIVDIDQFVAGLRSIREEEFGVRYVYDYVRKHPVDELSLRPYMFFSKNHYTRNLIFKNSLFELLAICWEAGQASRIHNHQNQNCWMAVPTGRLRVQNFRVVEQDERTGYCRLEPTDAFDIHRSMPTQVDPTEPVHQVLNLLEFNERALSLHIYSRPYDSCLVYALAQNHCTQVPLHYSSEYGRLCEAERL